ncbi:ubiquinone/menaquinone biosynthesis-related protein [Stachybotrys elegans]|uniref:Ubiquinone/menaquinone biosynthesis-related protein n=1 Tax=Stachybotrys elegans TaxID=80388 RepID=A0A8K0SQ33_9HYPO|nr:ubiquinone/menaquinone biosynthesis-related protein [Stachybotrys elegans]
MTRPSCGFARAVARLPRRCITTSSSHHAASRIKPPSTKPPSRVSNQYKPYDTSSKLDKPPSSHAHALPSPPPKPTNRPRPPPPNEPDTILSIWQRAWIPLTGAAVVSVLLGFYVAGTITASLKDNGGPCRGTCEHATPTGRPPALTGDNAEQFDKELGWQEWGTGIIGQRKRIAKLARGHVLELAIGTGRNLEYYDWDTLETDGQKRAAAGRKGAEVPGIESFTGLDISVDMLDVARKKLVKTVPPMAGSAPIVKASTMADNSGGQLSYLQGKLRLINSDAHHALPTPSTAAPTATGSGPSSQHTPAAAKYDTVIQTFGLCSVSDPVAVLSNLASVVKPGSGRIILLEHGKGWFGLVNGLLDRNAWKHFEKFGCWWNRDIPALVEEAVEKTPGLEIVRIERPTLIQMGTLVWVELKLKDNANV